MSTFLKPPGFVKKLSEVSARQIYRILSVRVDHGPPEWLVWLHDLGFIPGERVSVLHRGFPGGDPLVVRVGDSTFALRRAEAMCIHVQSIEPIAS